MPQLKAAGLPSASGYPLYDRLSSPVFSTTLIDLYTHQGVIGQITNGTSLLGSEISRSGSEVILHRAPEAEIHDYQKNQGMTHSDLQSDQLRFVLDSAVYWSLKVDAIDNKRVKNINALVAAFRQNAAIKIDNRFTREALIRFPNEASPYNKGACAGKISRSYNLGSLGKPLKLKPDNIGYVFGMVQSVLAEQDVSTNDIFIVVPPALDPLFFHKDSPFIHVCTTGENRSLLLTGRVYNDIAGLTLIRTNDLPLRRDPLMGITTYALLFGSKNANAFVNDQIASRKIDQNPDDWGVYWQGLQVYGMQSLRPEAIGVLYVTIDHQNLME